MMIAAVALSCAALATGARQEARLNCIDLAATPDLNGVSATMSLLPMPSPFGIAVTADGRSRYRMVTSVEGLPEPRSLGNYTVYIAWAYTVSLDSAVKLGEVRNGRSDLGELSYMQFRILITAERSVAVRERQGRLVLRGTSPGVRLLAHRDFKGPATSAMSHDTSSAMRDSAHGAHAFAGSGGTWPPFPNPPGMTTMPGMDGMVPRVSPFAVSDALPLVPPGPALLTPREGDTIALTAGRAQTVVAGRATNMFGYDGRVPGPRIDVQQGSSISVRVRNTLGIPTSVHWHGIRVENRFDGAVGITQSSIPDGSTFTYRLQFPDAGIFWYHPHVREDLQQGLGLFGTILVRPADQRHYSTVDREEVLVLSEMLAGDHGVLPFGASAPTHTLAGRLGNIFLVNGRQDYRLQVDREEVIRLFLVNASNARIYNLSLPGARIKLVGGDASKFEREEWVTSVVIGPSERYIVEVAFSQSGEVPLLNRVQAIDHMVGSYWAHTDTLAVVRVMNGARTSRAPSFMMLRRNDDVAASINPFRAAFDRAADRELVLTMRAADLSPAVASMLTGINAPIDWNDGMPMVNWMTTPSEITWVLRDPATNKENMDIDWRFRRGDIVKLRIFNDPAAPHAMAHPIHLHGQRFLVLKRDGVAAANLVWKDSAIVPAGETVEVLVDMSNAGRWMLHCHIAEHLSAGMMASFVVE